MIVDLPRGTCHPTLSSVGTITPTLAHITGNASPYFALRVAAHRKGFPEQDHAWSRADAMRRAPQFGDVDALHLADVWGRPMHMVENGAYLFEKLAKPARDRSESLDRLAAHFRISREDASILAGGFGFSSADARTYATAHCKRQGPRWAAEARAAIRAHGLTVTGDPWQPDGLPEALQVAGLESIWREGEWVAPDSFCLARLARAHGVDLSAPFEHPTEDGTTTVRSFRGAPPWWDQ